MIASKLLCRNFYQHIRTGEIYAIEMAWDGRIVGAAGPLAADALRSLDSYLYRTDHNAWLNRTAVNLIPLRLHGYQFTGPAHQSA